MKINKLIIASIMTISLPLFSAEPPASMTAHAIDNSANSAQYQTLIQQLNGIHPSVLFSLFENHEGEQRNHRAYTLAILDQLRTLVQNQEEMPQAAAAAQAMPIAAPVAAPRRKRRRLEDIQEITVCPICRNNSGSAEALAKHVRTTHYSKVNPRPTTCPWPGCSHRITGAALRVSHVATHTGYMKYPCPHCSRKFIMEQQQNAHIHKCHKSPAAASAEHLSALQPEPQE